MRTAQLRQTDLNLLVVFAILAEERNVSRAASRLLLSQPAVTRALQRLRATFHDELLVRVSGNYELTPKGQSVLHELEAMFPRLDRLLSGAAFDPAVEEAHFRIVGTDYAAQVIGAPLSKRMLAAGESLRLDITSLGDDAIDNLERGRSDLLLHADDGYIPNHFRQRALFSEGFVCVVSDAFPCRGTMALRQYLDAQHVGITIFDKMQTIPEERLRVIGERRLCAVNVWSFSAALSIVHGTRLVATVPRRLALGACQLPGLRIVKAPVELGEFQYLMAWHPRMETDAAHVWLRSQVQHVGQSLARRASSRMAITSHPGK